MQLKLLALAAVSLTYTLNAQTWTEAGDAGDLPGTAQNPSGSGALTQINGATGSGDIVDMYLIDVPNPLTFSASTCNIGGTFGDTRLFLFATDGTGLSFNDDIPGGCGSNSGLRSMVTGQFLPGAGLYLLAVTGYSNDAWNSSNQSIWAPTPFNTERQPDGPGAGDPILVSWENAGANGDYQIDLTGAQFSGLSQATCVVNGSGCGGVAATVYEDFDAGNPWDLNDPVAAPPTAFDVLLVAGGGTVGVVSSPSSPIDPPIGPDLGLGDDQSSPLIPIGFSLEAFGILADSISVQSNGCIWLGAVGSGDFSESVGELESQQARLAPYWNDLRPLTGGGGGTIHVDVGVDVAVITYDQVFIWGGTVPLTFQVEIRPTSMLVRYDPGSAFPDDGIVGFHNGTAQSGTLGSDLNGGAVVPVTGGPDMVLSCDSLPFAGNSLDMTLTGVPAGGIGAVIVEFLPNGPGVALPTPPFPAGCHRYTSLATVGLGLTFQTVSTWSISIPAGPAFLNLPIGCQGAALGFTPFAITTSNAIEARVGNF